jgi:hypothetical protein
MASAIALRQHNTISNDGTAPGRDEVLARYRQLREINRLLNDEILTRISIDALLQQARRLGLARGKTLIVDDADELNYAYDLAIYTASPQRSRAIDRYARSARFAAGSDEALMLEAMRAARFSVLSIERRHETAGLIATDLLRHAEVWLVDMGLEISMSEGDVIATRLYTPERFSMTAGVFVPFDAELIDDIAAEMPRRLGDIPADALADNRHFAETVYRTALASGIMDRMRYLNLPDDPQ